MIHQGATDHTELQQVIRDLLATVKAQTGVPGLGVALSIDGDHIVEGQGILSTDHAQCFSHTARFQLGCITKMLTSLVGSALIQEGTLDPSLRVSGYLDDLRDCALARTLTVNHLMSHTSGYQGLSLGHPGINYYYTWEKFADFLRTTPALFEPGTVFNYEHTEMVLLGEIVRRVTGREVASILAEQLFDPLGLVAGRIATDQDTPDIAVGDHAFDRAKKSFARIKSIPFGTFWRASLSDLTLSLADMVKLGETFIHLIDGRRAPLSPLLAPLPLAHMTRQVISLPRTEGSGTREQLPMHFGHGSADYGGPLYGHNGSARGQTCGFRFDPTHRVAIAVGLNAWQPQTRDMVINQILEAAVGYRRPARASMPPAFPIPTLAGSYIGPSGIDILVTATERGLKASVGNQGQPQRFDIHLEQDATGALKAASNTLHHSIGFFKDPGGETPCIMFGLSAFKKQ